MHTDVHGFVENQGKTFGRAGFLAVWWGVIGFLALLVSQPVLAQSQPSIPEPGYIIYGSVTNSGNSTLTQAGLVQIIVSNASASVSVLCTVANVNGQYFYVGEVPLETRFVSGLPAFYPTPGKLPLTTSASTYTRWATVDGQAATLAVSSRGTLGTFSISGAERGYTERLDLRVTPVAGPETYAQWSQRLFGIPNADPNADPDGDGTTNFAEYKAGTDPLSNQSVFRILDVKKDQLGGLTIRWLSTNNVIYTVERAISIAPPLSSRFTVVQSNISATPGTNSFRDAMATGTGPYFYRLRID